ncbi:hypothetical protein EVAR_24355_1 [Eumeta japonica]|uniref:Uncharacterized protein n=1 Tax=Eumeta variegata TaxID=151549 RepID=A0A4C1VLS0_EUMVA|nr:hypothetical protein EVAR_24355_1 [Eumeta japonica]
MNVHIIVNDKKDYKVETTPLKSGRDLNIYKACAKQSAWQRLLCKLRRPAQNTETPAHPTHPAHSAYRVSEETRESPRKSKKHRCRSKDAKASSSSGSLGSNTSAPRKYSLPTVILRVCGVTRLEIQLVQKLEFFGISDYN